jgi:hypothetical protein
MMEVTILDGNRIMITGTKFPGVIVGPKYGQKLIEYDAESYKQLITMLISDYGKEVAEDIIMTLFYGPKPVSVLF